MDTKHNWPWQPVEETAQVFTKIYINTEKEIKRELYLGFPGGASGKEPACQCRRPKRCRFNPQVRKIPWRRPRQHTPVFLPGESHGQRSLAGYSPLGRKESDMIEHAGCQCTKNALPRQVFTKAEDLSALPCLIPLGPWADPDIPLHSSPLHPPLRALQGTVSDPFLLTALHCLSSPTHRQLHSCIWGPALTSGCT